MPHRLASLSLSWIAPSLCLALLACTGSGQEAPEPPGDAPAEASPEVETGPAGAEPTPEGFSLSLRGADPEATPPPLSRPETVPLGPDETAALLARAPLPEGAASARAFAFRESSPPPPRAGERLETPFPPPRAAAPPPPLSDEPLALRRYQPEGEVPIAPRVTLTFSAPMVAVGAEIAPEEAPVRITPSLEGTWRWVGTQTLFFEPMGRAPMATDFTVEVPAALTDARGRPLGAPVRWTFHTPAPRIVAHGPSDDGPAPIEPVIWVLFDQQIDAERLLSTVRLKVASELVQTIPASETQRAAVARDLDDADAARGRWIAFTPAAPLPPDAAIEVTFPAGTPSAEGPRKTEAEQGFEFRTFGPLAIEDSRCGYTRECGRNHPFTIRFSNDLDAEHFEAAMDKGLVTVEPEPEELRVDVDGNRLTLFGRTRGAQRYTVRIAGPVKDTFGQIADIDETFAWSVAPTSPTLLFAQDPMRVLDPASKNRRLPVHVLNLDAVEVSLYRVTPADWPAWAAWFRRRHAHDASPTPPGSLALKARVETEATPEELTEVGVDLGPAMEGELGHVIAVIRPIGVGSSQRMADMTVAVWVQVTRIGLDAFADDTNLLAWVTDLASGQAIEGARLSLLGDLTEASSDAEGLARLPLPEAGAAGLVATVGEDVALLPRPGGVFASTDWQRKAPEDQLRWYVTDDRGLYRPGETVHVKGILRLFEAGPRGDIQGLPAGAVRSVTWSLRDARMVELGKGRAPVSPRGTFDLAFDLPGTPNLGLAHLSFQAEGAVASGESHTHLLTIQEFRRPEFEVAVTAAEGPHLAGGPALVTAEARYFAGGPLGDAPITWQVSHAPGSFVPPNHADFVFGQWRPWWALGLRDATSGEEGRPGLSARTDATGSHRLAIDLGLPTPPRPRVVTAEATVIDLNRQAWTSSAHLLVHPAAVYPGLRSPRPFVKTGEPIVIEAVAVDLDGERVSGVAMTLTAARVTWRLERGQWKEVELEPQTCELTSAASPETCHFTPNAGGQHRIRATLRDADGRLNETILSVWVAGARPEATRRLSAEPVEIIPSAERFAIGETAELLVTSPFGPAEGLLVVQRSGIAKERRFRLDGDATTLSLPIEAWMIPGVTVSVHLNGSAARDLPEVPAGTEPPTRPAYASGRIALAVPPSSRRLTVDLGPSEDAVAPGAETRVEVRVRDPDGQPVEGAEVTLMIVDEAVLALGAFSLVDPMTIFYALRDDGAKHTALRAQVLLASVSELFALSTFGFDAGDLFVGSGSGGMGLRGTGMGGGGTGLGKGRGFGGDLREKGEEAPPIGVRSDFNPVALFAPTAMTGGDGRVTVTYRVPDNLTRYRVMAIAASGAQRFGTAEAAVTARLPLTVRVSAPRFLNYGDRFELPVLVQNRTEAALTVDVAVRVENATLTGPAGLKVQVPAGERVEVRVPVATEKAGTARFQAVASAAGAADSAVVTVPVWTPTTAVASASYGVIDGDGVQIPVQVPKDASPDFGGLEIQTSATQLQALTDAVIYLVSYPYACAEQLASRILTIAALRDVLEAFQAEGLPEPAALEAQVQEDIARLQSMQTADGGFAFWRRDQPAWPFVSVHVTHALLRARDKGFKVPSPMLSRARRYLVDIRSKMPEPLYSPRTRDTIEAYALYVRGHLGRSDVTRARELLGDLTTLDRLPLDAIGWLYPVLAPEAEHADARAAITTHLHNRVVETASTAHFVSEVEDGAWLLLHSSRRTDGLLLEGLIADRPESDLIPKLVRGLLAQRKQGRWSSTQENAWVLLGLDRYFQVFEKAAPDLVARAWLGDRLAAEHRYKGRSLKSHDVQIPMQHLAGEGGEAALTLGRQGTGRLHYRVGMRHAPETLDLSPANHGFFVQRRYLPIDDPEDVQLDPDGRWQIRAGARVRVEVTMQTDSRRYHVALVDPLPAGLEAINPDLRGGQLPPEVSAPAPTGPGRIFWRGPWYEHQSLRDERAEAFASLLWEGVHTFTYTARATTPGDFIAPPPRAEEMYAPETFGRGATAWVSVR